MAIDLAELPLIEEMSTAEIERFISFLPQRTRDMLAEGPWPEPFCGVCRALEEFTVSGAAGALIDYHDTPFRRNGDTTHWREGHEVYARCLEIYRAAGWQGEVQHGWFDNEEAQHG